MKSRIMINATGTVGWTGGLYYKKNIAFELQNNSYIINNFDIVLLVDDNSKNLFKSSFPDLKIQNYGEGKINKTFQIIRNRGKYLFPTEAMKIPLCRPIHWFADFQHKYYPEYFTEEERSAREKYFRNVSISTNPLILSSKNAEADYRRFYGNDKKDVYVVPFVSFIEAEARYSQHNIDLVMHKYNLAGTNYAVIMNQFWQHKNHIIVFEAIEYLLRSYPNTKIQFVFTGMMEDYRNPEYINRLKKIADEPIVNQHISMLGFISREDQIAIMKNANFVIQPSLFEGWGTVVEDAKVLDKTILLSDIPVHREQMNDKCKLFDPYNPEALGEMIYMESQKEHCDDIEKGISDMYIRAKDYSKGFEQLLRDLEK